MNLIRGPASTRIVRPGAIKPNFQAWVLDHTALVNRCLSQQLAGQGACVSSPSELLGGNQLPDTYATNFRDRTLVREEERHSSLETLVRLMARHQVFFVEDRGPRVRSRLDLA